MALKAFKNVCHVYNYIHTHTCIFVVKITYVFLSY